MSRGRTDHKAYTRIYLDLYRNDQIYGLEVSRTKVPSLVARDSRWLRLLSPQAMAVGAHSWIVVNETAVEAYPGLRALPWRP